jgi:hypothetical protein
LFQKGGHGSSTAGLSEEIADALAMQEAKDGKKCKNTLVSRCRMSTLHNRGSLLHLTRQALISAVQMEKTPSSADHPMAMPV